MKASSTGYLPSLGQRVNAQQYKLCGNHEHMNSQIKVISWPQKRVGWVKNPQAKLLYSFHLEKWTFFIWLLELSGCHHYFLQLLSLLHSSGSDMEMPLCFSFPPQTKTQGWLDLWRIYSHDLLTLSGRERILFYPWSCDLDFQGLIWR